jgi:hypothetical protein
MISMRSAQSVPATPSNAVYRQDYQSDAVYRRDYRIDGADPHTYLNFGPGADDCVAPLLIRREGDRCVFRVVLLPEDLAPVRCRRVFRDERGRQVITCWYPLRRSEGGGKRGGKQPKP